MSTTAHWNVYTTPSKKPGRQALHQGALTGHPPGRARKPLKRGHDTEITAGNKTASKVMLTVLENIKLADDKDMMVCQDTGLPIYKILIGNKRARRPRAGYGRDQEAPQGGRRARDAGISAAIEHCASVHAEEYAHEHRAGAADHQDGFRSGLGQDRAVDEPKGIRAREHELSPHAQAGRWNEGGEAFRHRMHFRIRRESMSAGDCRNWHWRNFRYRRGAGEGSELLPSRRFAERRTAGRAA